MLQDAETEINTNFRNSSVEMGTLCDAKPKMSKLGSTIYIDTEKYHESVTV